MSSSSLHTPNRWARLYRRFGVTTIVAIYLLIMVGGIVRATGSGMGCPDWPKCFGQWVPPTDVSELPPDYKTRFAVQGKEIADFNAIHTWTEYLNRLLGALIGLFVLGVAVLSLAYRTADPLVMWLSLASFVLVGFQGWLGAVVVAQDLKPVTVTAHMLVALVIVGLLLYTVTRSYGERLRGVQWPQARLFNRLLLLGMGLMLLQIGLGTQVREAVDAIAKAYDYQFRSQWIEEIGVLFKVHRSYSIAIVALHAYMAWKMWQVGLWHQTPGRWMLALLVSFGVVIASGAIMGYFAIPRAAQPVHLLLASVIFGLQFVLWLQVNAHRLFAAPSSSSVSQKRPVQVA